MLTEFTTLYLDRTAQLKFCCLERQQPTDQRMGSSEQQQAALLVNLGKAAPSTSVALPIAPLLIITARFE